MLPFRPHGMEHAMTTHPPRKTTQADPSPGVGESARAYPHGSGDRNNKKSESDWKKFEGGEQRDAPPDGTRDGG